MQVAVPISPTDPDEQPLRLLLVRSQPGELPWLARVIAKAMAPMEIREVIGFANAIWRLGHERFDTVLLDVEIRDPAAMAYYREQISEVAAAPVLDLREDAELLKAQATPEPDAPATTGDREQDAAAEPEGRKGLRVPWQRRPRRERQLPASQRPKTAAAG